jgi:bifunctional DNase/RNase
MEVDGRDVDIDCRPSDAIALALRSACSIFVHEKVMEEAGRVIESLQPADGESGGEDAEGDKNAQAPQRTPLEVLVGKLEKAISDERYEDAARLRDEINQLKKNTDN